MALGSVSGDVSLLVRYAGVSLEIWLGLAWPRNRANSPLTERWPWGPARRGAPTILPAVLPAVLLSSFGAGGPRAFVTLSRSKLRGRAYLISA